MSTTRALSAVLVAWAFVGLGPAGVQGRGADKPPNRSLRLTGSIAARISYQGQLTTAAGTPLEGAHTMSFQLWDDESAGTQLGADIVKTGVDVSGGLFSVELDVPPEAFHGQAIWLRIGVDGAWLEPRQALLPAPYALTLRPGAVIEGAGTDPVTLVTNQGLGTGLKAQGGSVGIEASGMTGLKAQGDVAVLGEGTIGVKGGSETGHGVEGSSGAGSAVYGKSSGGHGVEGESQFTDGVYGFSGNGFSAGVAGAGATGVFGSGGVVGVSGYTEQDSAIGVIGTAGGNQGKGVVATANGTGGIGVEASAQLGTGIVASGETALSATGLTGPAITAEGASGISALGKASDGVSATSNGPSLSAAVRGQSTGEAFGGYFTSAHGAGLFVRGNEGIHAEDASGIMYAVHGVATGSDAVCGESTSKAGVYGKSEYGSGVVAAGTGAGADYAALRVLNTSANAGVAAYLTNSSNYANSHMNNTGTGEVLVLQSNGGRFMRAVDQAWDQKFRLEADGHAYADGAWHGGGADYAEIVPAVAGLAPGDVLAIGPDGRLVRSTSAYQTSVAGVYSTSAGFVAGQSADDGAPQGVPLAVMGIVPTKASAENGPIVPGDLLVAAGRAGHAMRAGSGPPQGTVIGKALEALGSGTGVIRVLVTLQ